MQFAQTEQFGFEVYKEYLDGILGDLSLIISEKSFVSEPEFEEIIKKYKNKT